MTASMWPLSLFRHDDRIESREVLLYVSLGEPTELMTRDAALALARSRGLNLIAERAEGATELPFCFIGKVSLPLRWERPPEPGPSAGLDENLWFEAHCGGRDLLTGAGHTFPGRMSAWCPQKGIGYNVSLSEMGEMSEQARYFIAGFLAGNEPGPPDNDDADADAEAADLAAWRAATGRFRRTGLWFGRWRTCEQCGCVLLPDTAANLCWEHAEPPK